MLLRLQQWQARARERGAVSVEFALIFFFLFLPTTFALIYGGIAFAKKINVTQSARDTARYGATYDITAAGGQQKWLDAVLSAAQASAGPANDPMGGYDYICVGYVDNTTSASTSFYETAANSMKTGTCPNFPTISNAKVVQVGIERSSKFFFLFANPTVQLQSVSSTPYEGSAP